MASLPVTVTMPQKQNVLGFSEADWRAFFAARGEKPYRAVQCLKAIHQGGMVDFASITTISKSLRQSLTAECEVRPPVIVREQLASDGTRKWLMRVAGGGVIETVFIPEVKRGTLCVSSQVGCALNCSFCSTARQGFQKNLTAAEIIGQLWQARARLAEVDHPLCRKITNVVMMGMGEPLLNLPALMPALALMRDDNAYGLAKRRVTVSTSGVVPAIDTLADQADVSLAVSLHAPNDALRCELVPINKKYNIATLLQACKRYCARHRRLKVTMEYVMLDKVNDTLAHAKELVRCLSGVPCKVNLIPFNPFPGAPYQCSSRSQIKAFSQILMQAGMVVTTRTTRGDDITAACGQLVGQVADRTRRQATYRAQQVSTGGNL